MGSLIRQGYCRDCRANVNHMRGIRNKMLWSLDRMSFKFLARFRIGSWNCLQCTKNSIYLRLPKPDAKNLNVGQADSVTNDITVESGGNYIKREKSIVARRERCSRYSAKYRENVVAKILEGHMTISEARRELNLTEQDILDWLAQALDDRDEKIEELSRIIREFTRQQRDVLRIDGTDAIPVVVDNEPPERN